MEQRSPSDYEVLREQLQSVLSMLTPLEQDVLKMRFGLDDGKCNTIKEVCERFGMTCLQVRVVEVKALRRLREMGEKLTHARKHGQNIRRVYVTQRDCGDATVAERLDANKRVWDYVGKFF